MMHIYVTGHNEYGLYNHRPWAFSSLFVLLFMVDKTMVCAEKDKG